MSPSNDDRLAPVRPDERGRRRAKQLALLQQEQAGRDADDVEPPPKPAPPSRPPGPSAAAVATMLHRVPQELRTDAAHVMFAAALSLGRAGGGLSKAQGVMCGAWMLDETDPVLKRLWDSTTLDPKTISNRLQSDPSYLDRTLRGAHAVFEHLPDSDVHLRVLLQRLRAIGTADGPMDAAVTKVYRHIEDVLHGRTPAMVPGPRRFEPWHIMVGVVLLAGLAVYALL